MQAGAAAPPLSWRMASARLPQRTTEARGPVRPAPPVRGAPAPAVASSRIGRRILRPRRTVHAVRRRLDGRGAPDGGSWAMILRIDAENIAHAPRVSFVRTAGHPQNLHWPAGLAADAGQVAQLLTATPLVCGNRGINGSSAYWPRRRRKRWISRLLPGPPHPGPDRPLPLRPRHPDPVVAAALSLLSGICYMLSVQQAKPVRREVFRALRQQRAVAKPIPNAGDEHGRTQLDH